MKKDLEGVMKRKGTRLARLSLMVVACVMGLGIMPAQAAASPDRDDASLLEANHASTELSADFAWQTTLLDWVRSLTIDDVSVPTDLSITYAAGQGATEDDLWPIWVALQSGGKLPQTFLITAPARQFIADDGKGSGFYGSFLPRVTESGGGNEAGDLEAAWFVRLDAPGLSNPYYQHEGLMRRLMAQSAVNLVESVRQAYGERIGFTDMFGMRLMNVAAVFKACYSVVGAEERQAFLEGMNYAMDILEDNGPRDVNTNMDTKTIAALAYIYQSARIMDDSVVAERAVRLARTFVLGANAEGPGDADGDRDGVIFHSAGYVGEQNGPETSYNGISIYYLSKAAALNMTDPAWAWMSESGGVVDRMATFKAHQIIEDPNGQLSGPSGYAKRTSAPYPADQSSSLGRDYMVAMISDAGKALVGKRMSGNGTIVLPDLATMEAEMPRLLRRFDFAASSAPMVYISAQGRYWSERHGGVFEETYRPGFYAELKKLLAENSNLLSLPVEGEPFDRAFGRDNEAPEFWSMKKADTSGRVWGAFVESVSDGGEGYRGGGLNGGWGFHGGGSVQSFWTEDGGLVINTRMSDYNREGSTFASIEYQPHHHLWGRKGSTPFSSARPRSNSVQYDNNSAPGVVTVSNTPELAWGSWDGTVGYERSIEALSDGLRIATTWTSDGRDADLTELWESIPVYRSANRGNSPWTMIEYWDGAAWRALDVTAVSTEKLRLSRDFGQGAKSAFIGFDQARKVKLASQDFDPDYQMDDRHRVVHVDLHPNSGAAAAVQQAEVVYTITTSDPDLAGDIGGDGGSKTQTIELQEGWNIVSRRVEPADAGVETLLQSIVERVTLMKDNAGDIYSPEFGIDGIGTWDATQAYQVNVTAPVTLRIEGTPIVPGETPIELLEGWNLVPYLPETAAPIADALASLGDAVEIVKDNLGRIYSPEYGIDDIGTLEPGQGYFVRVTRPVTLVY